MTGFRLWVPSTWEEIDNSAQFWKWRQWEVLHHSISAQSGDQIWGTHWRTRHRHLSAFLATVTPGMLREQWGWRSRGLPCSRTSPNKIHVSGSQGPLQRSSFLDPPPPLRSLVSDIFYPSSFFWDVFYHPPFTGHNFYALRYTCYIMRAR